VIVDRERNAPFSSRTTEGLLRLRRRVDRARMCRTLDAIESGERAPRYSGRDGDQAKDLADAIAKCEDPYDGCLREETHATSLDERLGAIERRLAGIGIEASELEHMPTVVVGGIEQPASQPVAAPTTSQENADG